MPAVAVLGVGPDGVQPRRRAVDLEHGRRDDRAARPDGEVAHVDDRLLQQVAVGELRDRVLASPVPPPLGVPERAQRLQRRPAPRGPWATRPRRGHHPDLLLDRPAPATQRHRRVAGAPLPSRVAMRWRGRPARGRRRRPRRCVRRGVEDSWLCSRETGTGAVRTATPPVTGTLRGRHPAHQRRLERGSAGRRRRPGRASGARSRRRARAVRQHRDHGRGRDRAVGVREPHRAGSSACRVPSAPRRRSAPGRARAAAGRCGRRRAGRRAAHLLRGRQVDEPVAGGRERAAGAGGLPLGAVTRCSRRPVTSAPATAESRGGCPLPPDGRGSAAVLVGRSGGD